MLKLILRKILNPDLPPDSHENRTRLGMLAGWTGASLSAILALVKGWLGLVSGSVSILADATNNLADMGSSLVIAFGFQWSRKPPDEEHPFGHGRIEAVVTLVLALALLLVGFEVARSGVVRLVSPRKIEAPIWLLVVVNVTVLVKTWMAIFARRLAKLSVSQVLEADAWNHTFDIVCTLMVVVALICAKMGWDRVDGGIAIFVASFILYTGYTYARKAIDILLGERPDPDEVDAISKVVVAVDGVMSVHEIMVHQYGDVKMVSFHIQVDADLSLLDAHVISENAEDEVEKELGWRALAHLDPIDHSHPLFDEVDEVLRGYVANEMGLVSMHDLRAEGDAPPYQVSFDLVTDMRVRRSQYKTIYAHCLEALQKAFADRVSQVEIGIEAVVESNPMVRKCFALPVPDAEGEGRESSRT